MKMIRTIAICLFAFVFCHVPALAQTSNAQKVVKQARRNYATIERNLKIYKRIQTDLSGQSSEGGAFVAYYRNGVARKISTIFYGEMGNAQTDYYFWNGTLFFILETRRRYDKPFGKVVRTERNRFYFSKGNLVRWLDENGKNRAINQKIARQKENEKRSDAQRYWAKAWHLLNDAIE